MKRLLLVTALAAAGCYSEDGRIGTTGNTSGISTFRVEARELIGVEYEKNSAGDVIGEIRSPLSVVSACLAKYGNDAAKVPAAVKGTTECPYSIPKHMVDVTLAITALDGQGKPLESFNGPVSYRVTPGDITGIYPLRWTQLTHGVGTGTVRVAHIYGPVRIWVQDEPPQVEFSDGGVKDAGALPPSSSGPYSYATGLTAPIYFEEPTLGRVQEPEAYNNNRLSPFAGQFLTVGRPPESGPPLVQSCPPGYTASDGGVDGGVDGGMKDPNDGKLVTMVVTGLDPGGFFVTDMTACRVREFTGTGANVRTPEPDGYLPGTYASLYVYNYSFPEGLYPGDLLWSLSGSVQEFTGTTQLTFPAWIIRERVREGPPETWGKYLDQVPVPELNLRHCGLDNVVTPYVTDALCGQSYGNMKMESLESALVKLRRVRFPQAFKSCDANGNGAVPFFCQGPSGGAWQSCADEPPSAADAAEMQCNIDCTVGLGEFAGKVCAERTSYLGFGQFPVELSGPGPRVAGLDEALDKRTQIIKVSDISARTTTALTTGVNGQGQVRVWCDTPVRVKFGPSSVEATTADQPLAARARLDHVLTGNEVHVAFLADGPLQGKGECHVALNSRTRVNIITRDAVPELRVDCSETDPDAERARQCRLLRAATYNVTGHVRQVTAARPRWMIMPRDADDICCFPGPEAECPRPIKQCPPEPQP
ncbi:single stranded DNA-binding domain-containing protein [Hyalangium gracile]|uniref:hypothetical protein n=1 Tax=Hyalangium gracile TaxID=394092 RepID=UPI001CCE1CE0|nr:hypothetical protein [Hyalangium gracile]